ncbi:MAG: hypothetical protein FWC89_09605 [Defluviitaleaceae bacterium]|nr:hypothetical protein [Defluviitaleaceae bacterium]
MNKSKLIIVAIAIAFLAVCLPKTAYATVDALRSEQFTIQVDGEIFELWGYNTDISPELIYLCLHDLAYMLNDTTAQFNIIPPKDDRWDFWIIRGEPSTPTGTEFQPIEFRVITRSDGGGLFGWHEGNGFINYPEQVAIVGIDGDSEPLTTVVINTIQDTTSTYFDVSSMAILLGFYDWFTSPYCPWAGNRRQHDNEYHEAGIDTVFITESHQPAEIPIQTVEFTQLLRSIDGHWVDVAYFYNPTIDENVVWPAEFRIGNLGINVPVLHSIAPLRPLWERSVWEWDGFWFYQVSGRELENGLVEITFNEPLQRQPAWNVRVEYDQEERLNQPTSVYNHRIVVDPSETEIITLYIDDIPHIMRRYNRFSDDQPRRELPWYQAKPINNDGIMLRYILNFWAAINDDKEIRVYRSATPPERMGNVHETYFDNTGWELLYTQIGLSPSDRLAFEFIDNTAQRGEIYYYTVWIMYGRGNEEIGFWHQNITPIMHVDVNEILGEPEPEEEQSPTIEEYQPTQLYPPTGNRTRTMAAATAAGLGVIAVAFVLIRRTTQRDK